MNYSQAKIDVEYCLLHYKVWLKCMPISFSGVRWTRKSYFILWKKDENPFSSI